MFVEIISVSVSVVIIGISSVFVAKEGSPWFDN